VAEPSLDKGADQVRLVERVGDVDAAQGGTNGEVLGQQLCDTSTRSRLGDLSVPEAELVLD